MSSKYVMLKAERSHCKTCDKNVYLLCDGGLKPTNLPAFYICFDCMFVGECGVGEVQTDPDFVDDEA
jgi:hypothetical protein